MYEEDIALLDLRLVLPPLSSSLLNFVPVVEVISGKEAVACGFVSYYASSSHVIFHVVLRISFERATYYY